MISTNILFGISSVNPFSKTLTISNAGFTISNTLLRLVCFVLSSTTYTDTFGMSISSPAFTTGTFTFSVTITRTDTNSSWGQNLQVQTILFYK
jgi:hypothetical protein